MANQTITALFDTYDQAADAVGRLEAAGVAHDAISIVSNDTTQRERLGTAPIGTESHPGTGIGASLGTVIGGGAGLLAGLGMLAIPGLGPVVAAGWLVATLVGAGIGAAAGGLVGVLTDAGVSETDAHVYAEGVRRGGTLVTVRADAAMIDQVTKILDVEGTVDLTDRQAAWRGEGWSGTYAEGTAAAPRSNGIGGVASRVGETIRDDAMAVRDSVTGGSRETRTPYPGASAVLVDPKGAGASLTDQERRDARDRVRVYPMDSQI